MEIFVLGTSGMMPLVNRHLTSVLVRRDGKMYLFDCGEGTQIALRKADLGWKGIDSIFVSHMHSDHLTGLPGLLMLSSQVDRTEPLHIYGPSLLEEYIESSRRILDMFINYEIVFHSVEGKSVLFEDDEIVIKTFPLIHTKPCYAFSMTEKPRPGVFSVEKAESFNVPKGPMWGRLQRGEDVVLESGAVVRSCDVVGDKRKGLKFTYVTDTMYFDELANFAFNSDILMIEGMFTHDLAETAHQKKHMTSLEAAAVTKDSMSRNAYLMHYSPRYADFELKYLLKDARSVCDCMHLAKDGMRMDLKHDD